MNTAFIGYGSMASALAGRFAAAGHEVVVTGRDAAKAAALAEEVGGSAEASSEAAVRGCDVVVIATPHGAVFDAIDAAGGPSAFAGKVVVDINNPVPGAYDSDFTLKSYDDGPSLAEAIQRRLPEARVVKAFNTCQADLWKLDPLEVDGRRFAVPICGDDADAKAAVAELVEGMGGQVWDAGGVAAAGKIEAVAALTIQLLFEGRDHLTCFQLVQPEQKPV